MDASTLSITVRSNRLLDHMARPREISATVRRSSNKKISRAMPCQSRVAYFAVTHSIHAQKTQLGKPLIQPPQFTWKDAPGVPRFENFSRARYLEIHVITGRKRSVLHVRQ